MARHKTLYQPNITGNFAAKQYAKEKRNRPRASKDVCERLFPNSGIFSFLKITELLLLLFQAVLPES